MHAYVRLMISRMHARSYLDGARHATICREVTVRRMVTPPSWPLFDAFCSLCCHVHPMLTTPQDEDEMVEQIAQYATRSPACMPMCDV